MGRGLIGPFDAFVPALTEPVEILEVAFVEDPPDVTCIDSGPPLEVAGVAAFESEEAGLIVCLVFTIFFSFASVSASTGFAS